MVELVEAHRRRLVGMMQHFTSMRRTPTNATSACCLVADAEIYRLDAVIRWLDSGSQAPPGVDLRSPSAPLSPAALRADRNRGSSDDDLLEMRQVSRSYGEGPTRVDALVAADLSVRAGSGGGDGSEGPRARSPC